MFRGHFLVKSKTRLGVVLKMLGRACVQNHTWPPQLQKRITMRTYVIAQINPWKYKCLYAWFLPRNVYSDYKQECLNFLIKNKLKQWRLLKKLIVEQTWWMQTRGHIYSAISTISFFFPMEKKRKSHRYRK